MMHQSINKKKIYFYLFIFLFLTTYFNSNLLKKFKETNLINTIHIEGIEDNEKIIIKKDLEGLINKNIFTLKKDQIIKKLNQFNFLQNIYVEKIFPSKINIILKKTNFLGTTIINGKKFYIGGNGKLTLANKIKIEKELPMVFGKFQVNEFLELQKILKENNFNINTIDKYFFYRNKRWDLQQNDGLFIMLPSKNLKSSLEIYKKLKNNSKLDSIRIIDLRITNQIILTHEEE